VIILSSKMHTSTKIDTHHDLILLTAKTWQETRLSAKKPK
jgi:hypothetical protein